jgi:hypothetical protein
MGGRSVSDEEIPDSELVDLLVESDGTPWGTVVKTSDGKYVNRVTRISWELDVDGGFAQATIAVEGVPAKVRGLAIVGEQSQELFCDPNRATDK